MKLATWLKQNQMTQQKFLDESKSLGYNFSIHAVVKWCSGRRIPRAPEMKAIHKVTEGNVAPNDFYGLQ